MQQTIEFAVKAHAGQVRKKNNLPYIAHPFDVLSLLASWKIQSLNVWRAAICHDVLEDCPHVTFEELSSVIGEEAAKIVLELTFNPNEQSKNDYMESFAEKSVSALLIKLADRICNTEDFLVSDPDYAFKYWHKALSLRGMYWVRHEEIDGIFGEEVFDSIRVSTQLMDAKLHAPKTK